MRYNRAERALTSSSTGAKPGASGPTRYHSEVPLLTPEQCNAICQQHDLYWDGRRDELRELRNLYMTRFFQTTQPTLDGILRTEVPKAYAVV